MYEINPWKKRFERERKARKEAEELLENRSLELWKINQNLEGIVKARTRSLQDALKIAKDADKAKSAFVANMSHEIRTPLNAILGFAELLQNADLPSKEKKYVDIISTSTNTLLNLVNDILDFSKIESGKIEIEENTFVVEEVLQNVYSMFTAKAKEKKIAYQILIDHTIPECLIGDQQKIQQVLANLLANSIKFTPELGSVAICGELLEKKKSLAQIRFTVEDTGIGIPENKLNEIILPFSQADSSITRKFGGTGLGLSISSQLVEIMGSSLQIYSEPNKHTKFWFDLQMHVCNFIKTSSALGFSQPNPYTNARILIAEDTFFNQELAKALLEAREMYDFDIAKDGLEAVHLFKQNHYDLVLMDINMPNMDGVTATQEIRNFEKSSGKTTFTPIIALTANVLKGDKEHFIGNGMNDYLAKPIEMKEFDRILKHYLGKQERVQQKQFSTKTNTIHTVYSLDKASKQLHLPIEKIQPIITRYINSLTQELDELWTYIKSGDSKKISHIAHRIKGASANFGMDQVASVASKIESSSQTNDLQLLELLFEQLQKETENIKRDLAITDIDMGVD